MDRIEISPASVAQVHAARGGRRVLIDDDVQGIARDLRDIDAALKLEFDPGEELYIVYQQVLAGDGSLEDRLVTVWSVERNGPVDKRLVHRIREIAAPGYDLAGELDLIDGEAQRRAEHEFSEAFGDVADRLGHALLKDLGEKPRVFVPGRRPGGLEGGNGG